MDVLPAGVTRYLIGGYRPVKIEAAYVALALVIFLGGGVAQALRAPTEPGGPGRRREVRR